MKPAPWTPLPTGSFTGIDWGRPGAADGLDPYLAWAEASRFAGYGGQGATLPLAIELEPACSIHAFAAAAPPGSAWLPPVYLASEHAALRFCTARVGPGFFAALRPGGSLHGRVRRYELGLAACNEAHAPGSAASTARQAGAPTAQAAPEGRLAGTVLGVIDDSFALAHANFLDARRQPRVAAFWRQDSEGEGRIPPAMGYGRALGVQELAAAIDACTHGQVVDEDAVYRRLGLSALGRVWPRGALPFHALDGRVSHGTHVLDIAAGPRDVTASMDGPPDDPAAPPSWAAAADAASRCPIIAVQLPPRTVQDTSGGSMNVQVLDGLAYILSRCEPTARVVVNISFGTVAGPHDGSSLLEAAMDQLVAQSGGRLQIVLGAGNSYQQRTHANLSLAPDEARTLHWRLPPDDATQSFMELWLGAGGEQVHISVTPPGRAPFEALGPGESGLWQPDGEPVCALVHPRSVATGRHGTCALLAVAPTWSFQQRGTAPAGVWSVRLHNRGTATAVLDAYIERDDRLHGARSGPRQSRLEDDPALPIEQQYDLQAFVDDPRRSTPIRRSGNFNGLATGRHTVAAGGTLYGEPARWAHYSPRAPDPDSGRPEREGVVKLPDAQASSDERRLLPGLRAAGTRSGAVVRLAGTSDAAPQVARAMLNEAARTTSAGEASSSA